MTNYFGKARLIKLFYHYISDRTEFLKSFKAYVNEFGKEIMFCIRNIEAVSGWKYTMMAITSNFMYLDRHPKL